MIYEFDSDVNRYGAYSPVSDSDMDELDRIVGIPIGEAWHRPAVVRFSEDKRLPLGDCTSILLGSRIPLVGEATVDALGDILQNSGELLPLRCSERPLWAYNCTWFEDVMDLERSAYKRDSEGNFYSIRNIVIRTQPKREGCFRLPRLRRSGTFFTESVAQHIRAARLTGFALTRIEMSGK